MKLLLLIFTFFNISCATSVKTSELQKRNLVGYWSSDDGSRFNYMEIKCDGRFQFITYDHEDKGVKISEITDSSFTTSPQLLSHYYQVFQWPNEENDYTIKLKHVSDSILQNYSASFSKLQSDKEKEIYSFRKTKKYSCK